jgi:AcrR family transcriptional regulator
MPTRERPYHHGDLRTALLAAAIREIESVGVEHLSLRSLATEVGVSPSAAYHHFADKDALIAAVALQGFAMLEQAVTDAAAAVPAATDPATRLGAAAGAYIDFAVAHPHLFRVAFSGHRPDLSAGPGPAAVLHPLLGQLLDDIAEAGSVPAEMRLGADALVWATVHGIATLVLEGFMRIDDVPGHLAVLERTMRMSEYSPV